MRISPSWATSAAGSTIVWCVEPLERARQEPVALALRHVREQHLPVRRAVERGATPDPAHAHDRACARDLVDVDDRVAGEHAEVHGLARPLGEVFQDRMPGPDEVKAGHRRSGETDEAEAQAVLLGHRVAFDETSFCQGGDQAGTRWPCGRPADDRARSHRAHPPRRSAPARGSPSRPTGDWTLLRLACRNTFRSVQRRRTVCLRLDGCQGDEADALGGGASR